ncbi:solute carrier family 25 member 32-like [Watersipora subatra]|uniref:solute carrier family 25 member 32-like n=1 Tax=Watersipora subatra TaxID=2589382 RepID=UPI00355C45CB
MLKLSDIKLDHLVAGVTGGAISTAALHPLDLIKVRLQVNDGSCHRPVYKGWIDCGRQVFATEGFVGLYKGVTPNIWGASLSWGFYFFFYNNIKSSMQGGDAKVSLGPTKHMFAAAYSGVLTLILTNPLWVAKTRMCLNYGGSTTPAYSSLPATLFAIWKTEGLRGLYKGFLPGMFGVSHGALQFMTYEELKRSYCKRKDISIDGKLSPLAYITCAALSKSVAVICTYPYQVIRSRLQEQHRPYNGVTHVIRDTYRGEGLKAFYKGVIPNLVRVTPACCITFFIYETMISHFRLQKAAS